MKGSVGIVGGICRKESEIDIRLGLWQGWGVAGPARARTCYP